MLFIILALALVKMKLKDTHRLTPMELEPGPVILPLSNK